MQYFYIQILLKTIHFTVSEILIIIKYAIDY